jgi:hypothetical protein
MATSTQSINIANVSLWYHHSDNFGFNVPPYVEGMLQAIDNSSQVRYIAGWDPLKAHVYNRVEEFVRKYARIDLIDANSYDNIITLINARGLDTSKLEIRKSTVEFHPKALSIDDKMLIVGSYNFDLSSWSYSGLPNWLLDLSEYSIAVDDPAGTTTAIGEYNQWFEQLWNNSTEQINVANSQGSNSIQDLVDQASANDTIILPEGVYQESVVIDKPLQIIGLSGSKTIIQPPAGESAFYVTSTGVMIYHLTIRGATNYGIELIDVSPNSLKDIYIRKILFENNALGGILVEGLIPGSPVDYVIENNTFIGSQYGIKINIIEEQAVTSTIRNNIFFEQSTVPIEIGSATDGGVEYSYNLFNNCARASSGNCPVNWFEGTLSNASSVHDNLINIAPNFVNPTMGDYSLALNSPLIDAGNPNTINEMGLDGNIPLQADIGAFETELMVELPKPFQEVGGQVVMDTTHFMQQFAPSGIPWTVQNSISGYTDDGYLSALPDVGLLFTPVITTTTTELQYSINFTTTGVYTVWLRGYAPDAAGDSLYVGLDDQPITMLTGFVPRQWSWANNSTMVDTPVSFEVTQPGLHILHLWQREDGLRLDRILLTINGEYTPSGGGPPESERFD